MGRLIQILILTAAVFVVIRLVRGFLAGGSKPMFGGARSKFPCATCKNCKQAFDDGVICVYGKKETFKNEAHIANCHDYERAG